MLDKVLWIRREKFQHYKIVPFSFIRTFSVPGKQAWIIKSGKFFPDQGEQLFSQQLCSQTLANVIG